MGLDKNRRAESERRFQDTQRNACIPDMKELGSGAYVCGSDRESYQLPACCSLLAQHFWPSYKYSCKG